MAGVVAGMPSALTSFISDAEQCLDDPEAIGDRLRVLLDDGGWLAPEQRGRQRTTR